mgnify:CR=1 FL=1
MKHWLLLFALIVPLLAACGGAPAPAPAATNVPAAATGDTDAPATTDTDGVDRSQLADQLFFYTWSDYIDPQILEDFEAEYGVRVVVDLFDSNEAMIPRIRAGNSGYDIVVPSDYAVQSMVLDGLLAPLDKSLLTNIGNLDPDLMNLYFDPGNEYSIPYFWGTSGIAYNQKFFDTPPTSWSAIFEPAELAKINNRFTMLEDPREVPGAALIYKGHSVNTTDTAVLAEVQELLIAQKPFVASYDSSNVNFKLATEEIILAHAWSGMAGQAMYGIDDKPGNPDIKFVIPDEGGVIWMDNLAIVFDSPNKYTAHVFINYLLRPEVAAQNTDWVLYLTPNAAAHDLLSEDTLALYEAGLEPDEETMMRLQWIERNAQTDELFSDLWTRVTAQ